MLPPLFPSAAGPARRLTSHPNTESRPRISPDGKWIAFTGGYDGNAEVYVMPTTVEGGERAAVCIVVDVRTLRRIETDLAASQAIFGQSPFGFLLIDNDLQVRRAQPSSRGEAPDIGPSAARGDGRAATRRAARELPWEPAPRQP